MGGKESKNSSLVMDDVIKFFDFELKHWNQTINNLKDTLKKPEDRSWMPDYLYGEMEQTETRWINLKASLIKPQVGITDITEGTCTIKSHKDLEDNIKQLRKNNNRLLENYQECETNLQKQKQSINECENCRRKDGVPSLAKKEPSTKPSDNAQIPVLFKENKEASAKIQCSEKDETIATLKKQTADLEEKAKKQKIEQDHIKVNFDKLQQQVKELEKQRDYLNERNKTLEMGMKNSALLTDTSKERQEASTNVQSSGNHEVTAKIRKKANELEEKTKKQKEEIDRVEAQKELKEQIEEVKEQRDNERIKTLEMDLTNATSIIDTTKKQNEGRSQMQEGTKTELDTGSLQKQIKYMQTDFERQKLKLLEDKEVLIAEKMSLESLADGLQKEKDVLLLRLSKIAGDRLVNNNDAIADLSDPNRPTKLGEFYSEIYDNEWTDAFDALKEAGYEEEEAIETLRLTLENVVQFCERKAALVIHKSTDAINLLFEDYRKSVIAKEMPSHLTMPRKRAHEFGKLVQQNSSLEDIKLQKRWKPKQTQRESGKDSPGPAKVTTKENPNIDVDHKLRQLRKEMATYMIPIVQKAYIEACWTNECIDALKPYILKCIYLGWMMVVQSPPMVLHRCHDDQEMKFEKNIHKEYTTSGPLVRYIVWPALLLKENGPVVCKGVAEGKKKDNV